jgi:hypothetical protein
MHVLQSGKHTVSNRLSAVLNLHASSPVFRFVQIETQGNETEKLLFLSNWLCTGRLGSNSSLGQNVEAHPSIDWLLGALFPEVKRPDLEAAHSLVSSDVLLKYDESLIDFHARICVTLVNNSTLIIVIR